MAEATEGEEDDEAMEETEGEEGEKTGAEAELENEDENENEEGEEGIGIDPSQEIEETRLEAGLLANCPTKTSPECTVTATANLAGVTNDVTR